MFVALKMTTVTSGNYVSGMTITWQSVSGVPISCNAHPPGNAAGVLDHSNRHCRPARHDQLHGKLDATVPALIISIPRRACSSEHNTSESLCAVRIFDCGDRAQRRHRFSAVDRASKAAWHFAFPPRKKDFWRRQPRYDWCCKFRPPFLNFRVWNSLNSPSTSPC